MCFVEFVSMLSLPLKSFLKLGFVASQCSFCGLMLFSYFGLFGPHFGNARSQIVNTIPPPHETSFLGRTTSSCLTVIILPHDRGHVTEERKLEKILDYRLRIRRFPA